MSFTTLDLCDGPECPNCGCRDAEILEAPNADAAATGWWGSGRACCNACKIVFGFKGQPEEEGPPGVIPPPIEYQEPVIDRPAGGGDAVPYVTIQCPQCGSKRCRVTQTKRPIRRHKCLDCEKRFKSVEKMKNKDE